MIHPIASKIEVTFLGTGTSTGVPVVGCNCPVCTSDDIRDKRFRTSVLIRVNGTTLVIDCGPDFRIQMLRNNVTDIDAILFTHGHRDHIAGLDDVRGYNYILNKKMEIFSSPRVLNAIKTQFPYIFANSRYFGSPQLNTHNIDNEPFNVMGVTVTPIQVLHHKLPIFGFRIGDFSYITDASYIADKELEKIKGSKVIVLNALRNSKHVSHFSLSEAIEILEYLQPERAYLTHMSHFIGKHADVEQNLPPFIRLAYDDLCIEV